MALLSFKSKAQNLFVLQNKLTCAKVLPVVIINQQELKQANTQIVEKIHILNSKNLIIRSSSYSEDNTNNSNAGAFLSIKNVPSNDTKAILKAIYKVAESMPSQKDEILIQPMLENIKSCGVAFSVDKENSAPYFCISYDVSGSNELITSGAKGEIKNFIQYRFAPCNDTNMSLIIRMLEELEKLFGCNQLDVEFAFAQNKKSISLYLLQVRPLIMANKLNLYNFIPPRALERLSKRIYALNQKHPHILGEKAIFGIMPDWNPAEIIGLKPKRLALSLYKEIVTDNIWAYQRDNYGYRNLRSYPLMHSFLGIPYIDVRLSFNSFIPKSLDEKIADKLVNFYLESLIKMPELHDKVEFDIVFSCYNLNTPKKIKNLLKYGFNENEIKRIEFSLLKLTNNILNPENGLYLKDLQKAKTLEYRYSAIMNSNLSIYDKIYWLIEDCKRFGTLPFAGVARAAFIAMQMLNSLVEIGFLNKKQKIDFLTSLNTVSKKLTKDIATLKQENIKDFLKQYGHLRAGSYNILSPRYDEAFESYFGSFDTQAAIIQDNKSKHFTLTQKQYDTLDRILLENGLEINAKALFEFFRTVIEGRESIKFSFSKFLSEALRLIKELGKSLEIQPQDMAHLDIKNILSLYSSLYKESPKERFLTEIQAHKEEFNLTLALKLPPLITKNEDIFSFYYTKTLPNFITQKSIMAETISISDMTKNTNALEGKIVLIPSADPGYDFLFTKNIAGLITCYGGANSHMAIRASELNLPSVIGVGEEKFASYLQSKRIRIECESEQIFCL